MRILQILTFISCMGVQGLALVLLYAAYGCSFSSIPYQDRIYGCCMLSTFALLLTALAVIGGRQVLRDLK